MPDAKKLDLLASSASNAIRYTVLYVGLFFLWISPVVKATSWAMLLPNKTYRFYVTDAEKTKKIPKGIMLIKNAI